VGGAFEGGIGMLNRGIADDPVFGAVAPNNWVDGVRGELRIAGTNAAGNAGFTFWLRASGNPVSAGGSAFYRQAFGWVKLFDDLVQIRGGRIHEDPFLGNQDFLGAHWVTNYHGLLAYITPTDMITIGVGAYSPDTLANDATWEDGALSLWGGVGVNFGLGIFRTQWRLNHRAAAADAWDDPSIDGLFSLRLEAIDNIPINATMRLLNVNDFGDFGRIDVQAQVGLNLVQDVGITVAGAFSTSQNDAHEDPFIAVGGWVTYTMGNIVPRLDLFYVRGGRYDYRYGFNAIGDIVDYPLATFNGDQSYLSIRPQVQFRATAAAWWEVGAIFNVELGDVGAAGGSSDDTFTFGFFTGVRVTL
jgi:hypothetical protein